MKKFQVWEIERIGEGESIFWKFSLQYVGADMWQRLPQGYLLITVATCEAQEF